MIKIQEVINNLQNKIDRYDKLVELINFIENKSSYTYDVKDIKIIELIENKCKEKGICFTEHRICSLINNDLNGCNLCKTLQDFYELKEKCNDLKFKELLDFFFKYKNMLEDSPTNYIKYVSMKGNNVDDILDCTLDFFNNKFNINNSSGIVLVNNFMEERLLEWKEHFVKTGFYKKILTDKSNERHPENVKYDKEKLDFLNYFISLKQKDINTIFSFVKSQGNQENLYKYIIMLFIIIVIVVCCYILDMKNSNMNNTNDHNKIEEV